MLGGGHFSLRLLFMSAVFLLSAAIIPAPEAAIQKYSRTHASITDISVGEEYLRYWWHYLPTALLLLV